MIAWLNGSDEAPTPEVEKEALGVLAERDWPNPVLSSAADRTSTITGKTGVKMSGPYDYVPPEYWYLDKDKVGGAFGFNMETSPGPAIPSVATIEKTLPKDSWWPIDEQWNYHAGLGKFAQYKNFTNAMHATYGKAPDLENYVLKAQVMAYDGERAMFEAYRANKYQSTGVIQWMLNNAWPSFIWHLYDYDLVAGGGYFGTRKANEPLHIEYRYDDRRVVVVNSTLKKYEGLKAAAQVLALDGKILSSQDVPLQVASDGVALVAQVPAESATTFLRLALRDGKDDVLSENFYWVPSELAQLDWGKSTYVNTPANHYADMRDLNTMEAAHVALSAHWGMQRGEARIQLENGKSGVAFFLHVRAVRAGTDEEIPFALWDDNFISLAPGETRVLTIHGLPEGAKDIEFKLDGWNVAGNVVTLRAQQRQIPAR